MIVGGFALRQLLAATPRALSTAPMAAAIKLTADGETRYSVVSGRRTGGALSGAA